MSKPTFQDLGLPDGAHVHQLLFNVHAQTIIAYVELPSTSGYPRFRFYVRHVAATLYRQFPPADDDVSFEFPVVCPAGPFLYYDRTRVSGDGGNPEGIFRADLSLETTTCILSCADDRSWWISRILGISGDGSQLTIVRASMQSTSNMWVVDYWLCQYSIPTAQIVEISKLEAVFV